MKQHLKLKALLFAFVTHVHRRLQLLPSQRDAVLQPKVIRPGLAHFIAERGRIQTEIELDAVMAGARATTPAADVILLGQSVRLGCRLAEILPAGITGKAVRWKRRGCMVGRRRPKVLWRDISVISTFHLRCKSHKKLGILQCRVIM